MITRLKRIYGFIVDMIIPYVTIMILMMFVWMFSMAMSINQEVLTSIYINILVITSVMYWIFKSEIFKGQTPFNKIFRLRFEYKKRWHLIIKNIIDLFTFPISFVTVLLINKSISEIILKTKCVDLDNGKEKDSYYSFEMFLVGMYTLSFLMGIFVFSNRISLREEFLISDLKYSETISSEIGEIEKLSFRRINIFGYRVKDGKYTIKTYITNKEHKKYKVDIYMDSETSWFVSFIIDGNKYDENIKEFNLDDYLKENETYITSFQDNNNDLIKIKEFRTTKEAINIAKDLFKKYFGESFDSENIEFYYDREKEAYLVIQYFDKSENVEKRIALLKTDGSILGIWE